MFKWLSTEFNRMLGFDGCTICGDEHMVMVAPGVMYYIKIGSDEAKERFPIYYQTKTPVDHSE